MYRSGTTTEKKNLSRYIFSSDCTKWVRVDDVMALVVFFFLVTFSPGIEVCSTPLTRQCIWSFREYFFSDLTSPLTCENCEKEGNKNLRGKRKGATIQHNGGNTKMSTAHTHKKKFPLLLSSSLIDYIHKLFLGLFFLLSFLAAIQASNREMRRKRGKEKSMFLVNGRPWCVVPCVFSPGSYFTSFFSPRWAIMPTTIHHFILCTQFFWVSWAVLPW